MKTFLRLRRDEQGAAAIEMAFALPILILMIWMIVQLAQVYRAMAGIQQALGQGARYATLCLNPTTDGCSVPTAARRCTTKISERLRYRAGDIYVDTTSHAVLGTPAPITT